jgi:hypothetical protein
MFTFEFLKIGKFALRSAKHGAFEILEILAPGASPLRARAIARVEIERDDAPSLRVTRVTPDERLIPNRSCAHVDSVTLISWRDELPTDFELNASGTEEGLDLVLSGHRHYHLFWWRVQFEIVVDDVIIHGPFLADNPSS